MKRLFFLLFLVSCGSVNPSRGPANGPDALEQFSPLSQAPDDLVGLHVNSEEPVVYDVLRGAQKSLEIEIYEMKDSKFRSLLIEALAKTVKVRIIKDPRTVGDSCDELEPVTSDDSADCQAEKTFVTEFKAKGGEYVFFNKTELCAVQGKSCFEHGKMVIRDGNLVLLSTGNFNPSSLCDKAESIDTCNRDYSFVTRNPEVIATLSSVWENDFQGQRWDFTAVLTSGNLSVTTSPESRPRLVALLKSAKKSIRIQNQYLEDPVLNQMLVQKASEGIEVKVQVADFCNYGAPTASKRKKIEAIYSTFEGAGIDAKVFTSKISVSEKKGYLHAKAIVIDESVAWIGSINGSVTSTTQNREFGIIFRDEASVKKLLQVMEQDFTNPSALPWKTSLACPK